MASARAKLRCCLALVRSATRASISASEKLRAVTREASASLRRPLASAFENGEDAVEFGEECKGGVGIGLRELISVGGTVDGAEDVEDGGAGLGGVEIVSERRGEGRVTGGDECAEFGVRLCRRPFAIANALMEGAEAVYGVGFGSEAVEGEV